MAKNPFAMRKLTLLGARHLLKGGHISKSTHSKMVKSVKAKAKLPPMEPQMDPELGLPEPQGAPLQFGSLNPADPIGAAPPPAQSPGNGLQDQMLGMLGGFLR